jgi:CheY-like chemotaxis protein
LILLDLRIPALNGFDVLKEVRKDARFSSVPVVALTALAMAGDREKALAAGFNAYLTKPVALAQLRSEVERLLAR